MKKLTLKESYATTYLFLKSQNFKKKSADLSSILSSMSTLQDGSTADPATWFEWLPVAAKIIGEININIHLKELINFFARKKLNVNTTVNWKNELFISAIKNFNLNKVESVIKEISAINFFLDNDYQVLSYKQIFFRLNVQNIMKKYWIIADENRMKEIRNLFSIKT